MSVTFNKIIVKAANVKIKCFDFSIVLNFNDIEWT